MDINIFFRKIIVQSETIRDYLERENISIPPRAMYAYVCNGDFVWEEKKEFFKELLNATDDAELKEQMQNKLDEQERALEMFKNPDNCVYMVKAEGKTDASSDFAPSAYADYESARWTGQVVYADDFTIYKKRIIDRKSTDSENEKNNRLNEAEAHFRKDGKLKNVYLYTRNEEGISKSEKIEDAGYTYPHPFKLGDIVYKPGNEECIFVIKYVQENNEKFREYIAMPECGYCFNEVELTCLNCKTGIVTDDVWQIEHPYELEYYPAHEEKQDELAYKVLAIWSEILKGKSVPLQVLLETYSQFRKQLEAKEENEKWDECLWDL